MAFDERTGWRVSDVREYNSDSCRGDRQVARAAGRLGLRPQASCGGQTGHRPVAPTARLCPYVRRGGALSPDGRLLHMDLVALLSIGAGLLIPVLMLTVERSVRQQAAALQT